MSNVRYVKYERKVLLYTDPTRHPSLILVEALDLSQVGGWGALYLETLLGTNDSQRIESKAAFDFLSKTLKDTYISTQHLKLLLLLCASKHNKHKRLSVSMPTPLSVATTETVLQGFHSALGCSPHIHFGCLCTLCQLCPSEGSV